MFVCYLGVDVVWMWGLAGCWDWLEAVSPLHQANPAAIKGSVIKTMDLSVAATLAKAIDLIQGARAVVTNQVCKKFPMCAVSLAKMAPKSGSRNAK